MSHPHEHIMGAQYESRRREELREERNERGRESMLQKWATPAPLFTSLLMQGVIVLARCPSVDLHHSKNITHLFFFVAMPNVTAPW
ncbi:hypothetical protein EYF80_003859 [Liparis tanakae]|uniref:Uncharacterized protein n=1 Tax=Liparis tanakae TaxID=230148 RepID=A0A4Z2J6J2_9TELE|nr:hypothetical protein EYF80_003859 [Liparis tanakae]